MLPTVFAVVCLCSFPYRLEAQKTVTFPAKDGLVVTADLYEIDPSYSYVVLFHQAGSSRGEFREIAPRFTKLGYNCLAVDLRSGNEINFVVNQTALRAREQKLATSYFDAIFDMQAAIEYAANISRKPVVVLGSSFSASLALILATKNPQISAVIAFSPGEYFEPRLSVSDTLAYLNVPVWIGGTKDELPYLKNLTSKLKPQYLSLFTPIKHVGKHGAVALWADNPSKDEYWFSLLLFFNQIKE
ncbi:MAG: dienelactone hydrolase family protein [Bacteroidales bacterium]|nr:dienelactone hydrolase family protein [Bacteroidales bacterium]